jgi:tungstate transport system substrate-binding protein
MLNRGYRLALALVMALSLLTTAVAVPGATPTLAQPENPDLILGTTTSTQDSGLLDVLVPRFEQQTGYKVKTISVGTGAALELGARGEADVLLVHAPESEIKWMAAGNGADRKLVMYNDFIVVGPADDPAGLAGASSATEVLQKIIANGATFVSRGDNSGTNQLELALWKSVGFDPKGQPWYIEAGQGMGAVLTITSDKQAYTITDRATYLARKSTLDLDVLAQGYPSFLNIYHVITVNPEKGPRINAEGARAFESFVLAPDTQAFIGQFGVDKFGQQLFFPAADRQDSDFGL